MGTVISHSLYWFITGDGESFETFIRAIFYVGKGQKSRPYQHFKEAIAFLNGAKNKVTCLIGLVPIDYNPENDYVVT